MPTVQDILARKGSDVISVKPGETVFNAAQLMSERGIGGLVVTEGGRLVGIFTERDILRRVVAPRRDAAATKVAEVMTTPVTACSPETPVDECAVVTERGLAGMITIGDVLAFQVHEQQATIDYMHHFMFDLR